MCRLLLIDLKQLSQIFRKHSCEIIPLKTETFNDSKLFSRGNFKVVADYLDKEDRIRLLRPACESATLLSVPWLL
jgi:hypothetical protein